MHRRYFDEDYEGHRPLLCSPGVWVPWRMWGGVGVKGFVLGFGV